MQTSFELHTSTPLSTTGNSSTVLREGSVLQATVDSANSDGTYTLKSGDLNLSVRSDFPLQTGQKLNLLATRSQNGTLSLQILPDAASSSAVLEQTAQITKSLSISIDSSQLDKLGQAISEQQDKQQNGQTEQAADSEYETVSDKGLKKSTFTLESTSSAPISLKAELSVDETKGFITLNLPNEQLLRTAMNAAQFAQNNAIDSTTAQSIFNSQGVYTATTVEITLEGMTPEDGSFQIPLKLGLEQLSQLTEFMEVVSVSKEALSVLVNDENMLVLSLPSGESLQIPLETATAEISLQEPFTIIEPRTLHLATPFILSGTATATVSAPFISQVSQEHLLADTLLKSAGLTPSPSTREAAAALIETGLPVSRQNVQTLLSITAGKTGVERTQTLMSAAQLLDLDAPVSPVLTKGMSNLTDPTVANPVSKYLGAATENLASAFTLLSENELSLPVSGQLDQALKSLQSLSVLIGEETTPEQLQNFTRQLGRGILFEASQAIEVAAGAIVNQSPELKIIDAVLDVILPTLSNESPQQAENPAIPAQSLTPDQQPLPLQPQAPEPNPIPGSQTADSAVILNPAANTATESVAPEALAQPHADVSATLSSQDQAGTIADQPNISDQPVNAGQVNTPTQAAENNAFTAPLEHARKMLDEIITNSTKAASLNGQNATTPEAAAQQPADIKTMIDTINRMNMFAGDRIGGHPGVNNFADTLRLLLTQELPQTSFDRPAAEQALHQIFNADSPQQAAETTRHLMTTLDRPTLRAIAHTLQMVEKEEVSSLPGMKQLREASESIRELGRSFIAQKAQNLSTMRQDPGVFAANIPLKFGNDGSDGNLQMFYRKGQSKSKKSWQHRIMLELNMSALGNVIGDMRFHNGQLNLTLLSQDEDSVNLLQSNSGELADGLEHAGFPCTPGFRLIKPPKEPKAEDAPINRKNGKLDIKA